MKPKVKLRGHVGDIDGSEAKFKKCVVAGAKVMKGSGDAGQNR
jgi:hypothetical protein